MSDASMHDGAVRAEPTSRTTRCAARLGMTEGQLYSAVFVMLVVLLLTLTGLPTAERRPATGSAEVPTLQTLDPEPAP